MICLIPVVDPFTFPMTPHGGTDGNAPVGNRLDVVHWLRCRLQLRCYHVPVIWSHICFIVASRWPVTLFPFPSVALRLLPTPYVGWCYDLDDSRYVTHIYRCW